MSKPQPPAAHPPKGAAVLNEDGLNITKIVVVGVVSLVIFAISAVIAGLIVSADETTLNTRGIAPLPADITKKEEVGIVDYVMFDSDTRLTRWRAEKAKALSSYGWVDRKKGIIHVPIDEAMKEVIREGGK